MREYVEKTLHTRVDCEPVDASGLPLYLRGLYSLERWTAFGVPFAVASPVESPTVKTMTKHRDTLEAALGTPVSFALEGATGYRVGRMLEAGLPFIAPDKQVYLPFLGIELSGGSGRRARHWSRRARGSRVRGAGAALRARAGAGMRRRPAFGHPVPSRRREGRPARRGRNRERFDPSARRRS